MDGLFLSPEPLCSQLCAFALELGLLRTALSSHLHLFTSLPWSWFWVRWRKHAAPCLTPRTAHTEQLSED